MKLMLEELHFKLISQSGPVAKSVEKIRKLVESMWSWIIPTAVLVLAIGWRLFHGFVNPPQDARLIDSPAHGSDSYDTYIPHGHRLYPVQLVNQDSLQAFMGPFAIVDLYQKSEKGLKGRLVGKGYKLVRSPTGSNEFALLLQDQDVAQVSSQEGAFFAVLQNPNQKSETFTHNPESEKRPGRPHRVEYFHE